MEKQLNSFLDDLEHIKVDLRKLGPERRSESLGKDKIKKSKEIYVLYKQYLETYNLKKIVYGIRNISRNFV